MNITVRDVNPHFWRELKIEAVKEGLTIGQTMNLALENWFRHHKGKKADKKAKSFWDIEPVVLDKKDAKNLSTMVDKVLYG